MASSSSSSSSSSSLSSMSSSSSSAMSSASSSSSPTRAASSSSPPPAHAAPAPAPAPPVPSLLDDTSFPPLGTAPPRPPRSGRVARPLRNAKDRRERGKAPSYSFDRDTVKFSIDSLCGRADDTAPGTAATADAAEGGDTAAETAASDEELDAEAEKTSDTAEAGGTAQATISARPPICASPGSLAEAAALLSGAPTLSPAAQAFGGYRFGTTFGDFFQDLEALQGEPQDVEALQVEPPPPRDLSLVPTGPPSQFVAPRLAHYGNATRPMQFAAPPQHMRFHLSAPGRPALFIDVQWRYKVTPPHLPHHPQGALQLYGHPPVPPVGQVGSPCWDCQARPAERPFPCGHVFLCRPCYKRRISCPCCAGWVPSPF
ncbi:putative protein TPRXL [Triticum aestivum]|uniref:putative protein TPRXL n=1 Tax=Triticum aestivum TaxID=4565 RepID=UPI001D022D34|nr:putative protein TPRXL [Triticum aestivum]XP_044408900.1 putative protein TPRXL [Triticum aestivum]